MICFPEAREDLKFTGAYTGTEFAQIRRGLRSYSMEEKWDIYYLEPWLYFVRSWTGFCIFGLRMDGVETDQVSVVESWVDPQMVDRTAKENAWTFEYARALVSFIIDRMLLAKAAEFPIPDHIRPNRDRGGLYQFHICGTNAPEKGGIAPIQVETVGHSQPVTRPAWPHPSEWTRKLQQRKRERTT